MKYSQMYRVKYGAEKTKVTVTGSEIDRQYYYEVRPWKMDGQVVNVVEDNDHLGQVVSGVDHYQKNTDLRLRKARQSLYSLLGSGLAYKSLLSPVVKLHLYKTFTCPILRSGLSTFSLRQNQLESLGIFQRKFIKSALRLNDSAATPGIHFISGQLALEALIHCDVFCLIYNVGSNPKSYKVYQIVKYLISISKSNSRTWAQHVRNLCTMYKMEDPLSLLNRDPPSKAVFKNNIKIMITAFHEGELRKRAEVNSCMTYFNVSTLGLNGKCHPSISGTMTTVRVK